MFNKFTIKDFIILPFKNNVRYFFICLFKVIYSFFYTILSIYLFSSMIEMFMVKDFEKVFIFALLYSIVIFIQMSLKAISNRFFLKSSLKCGFDIDVIFMNIINKVPFKYIEDNKFYNDIEVLKTTFIKDYMYLHTSIIDLIRLVVEIITLFIYIAIKIPYMSLLMLIIGLLITIVCYKNINKVITTIEDNSYNSRYCEEMFNILTDSKYANERSIFNFYNFVIEKWQNAFNKLIHLKTKTLIFNVLKMEVTSTFLTIIIFINLIYCMLNNLISISILIPLINQIVQMLEIIRWQLNAYIEDMSLIFVSIKKLNKILSTVKEIDNNDESFDVESIEFRNVSFKYDGLEENVLNNISFKIDSNKNVALIGENGSGKSTIIKLLLKFYDNYEGQILINGIDLRKINTSPFSLIFQDFCKYYLNIDENILISNFENKKNIDFIKRKLKIDNVDTNIILNNSDESNCNLSIGKWQTVAIARALNSKHKAMIMDEPNSALDVYQEKRFYDFYTYRCTSSLSLIVSHRLTVSKIVDEILVLDKGKIIEKGNHETLMKNENGFYKEFYDSQRSLYETKH